MAGRLGIVLVALLSWAVRGEAADEWQDALRLQVALDRLGFSPGLIDGQAGRKTAIAMRALAEARGAAGILAPQT